MTRPLYTIFVFSFLGLSCPANAAALASLVLGTAAAPPNGVAPAQLSLAGTAQPAALQWTLTYSPTDIAGVTVTEGPAAAAASKSVTCASTPGRTICILVGLNQNVIAPGVVASIGFRVAGNPSSAAVPVQLTGTVAASPAATEIPSTGSANTVTVTAASLPALTGLSCASTTLVSLSSTNCVVTLDRAVGPGGTTVLLTSSFAGVALPRLINIPAGASTANFTATVSADLATDQVASITATSGSITKSLPLTLTAAARLASLTCPSAATLAGSTAICTVTLSKVTPAGGAQVKLTSSAPAAVSVPAQLTVSAGQKTMSFTATFAAASPTQSVTLSALAGSSVSTASVAVTALPRLANLDCTPLKTVAGTPLNCVVTLAGPAPAAMPAVLISTSSPAADAPDLVRFASGSTTAPFTVATSAVNAPTTVTVTVALGASAQSATLSLSPASLFHLRGATSEVIGTANGSIVSPTVGVPGLPGRLTVRGTGYVSFVPFRNGAGLSFEPGGAQTGNTAFMTFTGAALGQVLKNKGQISFTLKSNSSLANRITQPLNQYGMVFDAYAGSTRIASFMIYTVQGRLGFMYCVGGSTFLTYLIPQGAEESTFGVGAVVDVRLAWDGATVKLFLNGTAVKNDPYTPIAPNWTPDSSLTVGAMDVHTGGGGLFASGDAVADFEIR